MNIQIEKETDFDLDLDYEKIIDEIVNEALDYMKCPYEIELNVVLSDNEGIHQVNLEQREIDAPTDVLSFPNIEYDVPANFENVEDYMADYFEPDSGELILGDIIISVDKVQQQALEYGHSQKREFAFLVAHSMLHLCGYDHMTGEEEKEMISKQEAVLNNLSITRE